MENMTQVLWLLFKKKYQLQFFEKLFTYGSGTYMKNFNEQQRE